MSNNTKYELSCQNCGTPLSPEQYSALEKGTPVYCEKCGWKFEVKRVSINSNQSINSTNSSNKSKNFKSKMASFGNSLKKAGKKAGKDIEKASKKAGKEIKRAGKEMETVGKDIKKTFSSSKESGSSSSSSKKTNNNNNSEYTRETSNNSAPYQNIYRKPPQSGSPLQVPFVNPFDSRDRQHFPFFRKMNILSISLAWIHLMIYGIILLMSLIPNLESNTINFQEFIFRAILPLVFGLSLILYDTFYVRVKIENYLLKNYAIDFFLVGLFMTIFAGGVGIYLMIKSLIMMVFALTENALFTWKFDRTFSNVLLNILNVFGSLFGFAILLVRNPWIWNLRSGQIIYFYFALGALTIDLLLLRLFAKNRKMQDISPIVAIGKLILGVIASFFYLSGIILGIEGLILTVGVLFARLD